VEQRAAVIETKQKKGSAAKHEQIFRRCQRPTMRAANTVSSTVANLAKTACFFRKNCIKNRL
jgi:hypothetical protein